jgi:hypothetical protein
VAQIVVSTLQELDLQYPPADTARRREIAKARRFLAKEKDGA